MKGTALNFLIDFLGFINMLGLVGTGIILKWILPPGSGGQGREMHGGHGGEQIRQLLGMGRHEWGDIHYVLALFFMALVLIHIILHWNWIKCYVTSRGKSRKECDRL